MAISRLGSSGHGAQPAGSFAGKASGEHPVGVLTRSSGIGYGTRRCGSFAGKAASSHPVGRLTRLGSSGYGVRRSGSFDLKTATTEAVVSQSGGWVYFPRYKRQTDEERKRERIALGIIPDDVEKAVTRAVETTVQTRTVADAATDLQAAEMELRAYLAQVRKDMVSEYIKLLAMEYARIEQEYEDAQIAWLLFEM